MLGWRCPRGMRAVGVLGLAFAASTAVAAPGDHLRLGDAVITPSVMTGMEYHSNVYLADGRDQAINGALAWVLNPGLSLELKGKKLSVSLGMAWNIRKYLDLAAEDGINVQNADRLSDSSTTLALNALPEGLIGARLEDKFDIQNLPAELPTADSNSNIVHISNDATGGLAIHPGSALEIGVLGNLGLDAYTLPDELVESGTANINNRVSFGPVVNARWKFLPKTSLLGMASVNWTKWQNNFVYALGPETEQVDYGDFLGKPDALAWRTQWGVRGQFTDRFAVGAELGYGQMYYDEATTLVDGASLVSEGSAELDLTGEETFAKDLTSFSEGLLVNALVAYAPAKGHSFTLGYRKDFQDAFFTNYVAYNYLFLRYQGLFVARLGVTGELTYRIDSFHGEVFRDDQSWAAKIGGAYRFNEALSTGLSLGWNERACLDAECEGGNFYSTQYDDFWTQLGVSFAY